MSTQRILASPLARHMAKSAGLELAHVHASGPGGRIIKRDIEAMLKNPTETSSSATPKATLSKTSTFAALQPPLADARAYYEAGSYDEIPLEGMRTAIAARLTQSMQQIPHFYLTRSLPMSALMDYRASINVALAECGEKISLNDLLMRAVALALMDVPEVNVSFAGDAILRHHHADIGVAVALPGGLITPIVTRCEEKPIRAIATEIRALAASAAQKRLKPSEYEGGSFSVSNLGMLGIDRFTAVINPPQAAILAVGGVRRELRMEKNDTGKDTVVEDSVVDVTLSCDHRAIDGALGAQFLTALAVYVTKPMLLVL